MKVGAVILGAGFGTRLAPLTDSTPKPLLEISGRPVVSHLVDRLSVLSGLVEIVVVVNDRHPDQWTNWTRSLTNSPKVRVVTNGVIADAERLGAVADLSLGVSELTRTTNPDWIAVLAGDNLLDEPLQPHLNASIESSCPVVLCRDLGEHVPPGRFGEITVDIEDVIIRFREKPAVPESPLAATCTYVLPGDVGSVLSDYLVAGDADSPGSFIGWLSQRRPVMARPVTGRYFDIGNHETLAAARANYRSR